MFHLHVLTGGEQEKCPYLKLVMPVGKEDMCRKVRYVLFVFNFICILGSLRDFAVKSSTCVPVLPYAQGKSTRAGPNFSLHLH